MPTITLDDQDNTYIDDQAAPDLTIDTIFAGGGNDSIFSSTGDDVIYGGTGNDTISSNAANLIGGGDLVYGGEGDDLITTTFPWVQQFVFRGGYGFLAAAAMTASSGLLAGRCEARIPLFGGGGNDTIDGNSGGDVIDLGGGDDLVINRVDADTIDGGSGVDTIDFTEDHDSVVFNMATGDIIALTKDGETDVETATGFENVIASAGNDDITGNAEDNTLHGLGGDDTLRGEDGADLLIAGGGADSIDGGDSAGDVDTLSYAEQAGGVTVIFSSDEAGSVIGATAGNDQFTEIERLVLTDLADFVDARLDGLGVEVVFGEGDDVFRPGAGADEIFGGGGSDRVNLVGAAGPVSIDNTTGAGTGGVAEGDVYDSFEEYVLTNFDDTFQGNDEAESIIGAAGNDTLMAGGGDDSIEGDTGNDIIDPGTGDDVIDGDSGTDTISFASADAPSLQIGSATFGAFVNLSTQDQVQNTGYGNKTLNNIENAEGSQFSDLLTGNGGINVLTGGDGGDVLRGGGSNDVLYGGDGFDALEGGLGNDQLFGGDSFADLATYFQSNTALTFVFGASISEITGGSAAVIGDTIGTDIEGIAGATGFSNTFDATTVTELTFFLGGGVADTFFGGSGTDQLVGLGGNDVIHGNDGVDAITAGAGDDDLFGGAGGDAFFFDGSDGNNTIHDFETGAGGDLILFTGDAIGSLAELTFSEGAIGGGAGLDTVIEYSAGGQDSSITILDVDLATFQSTGSLFV